MQMQKCLPQQIRITGWDQKSRYLIKRLGGKPPTILCNRQDSGQLEMGLHKYLINSSANAPGPLEAIEAEPLQAWVKARVRWRVDNMRVENERKLNMSEPIEVRDALV